MPMLSPPPPTPTASSRPLPVLGQVGFALLAGTVFGVRVIRTGTGSSVPDPSATTTGVVLGLLAVVLSFLGAALVTRGRAAVPPLALALVLELSVLDRFLAPPRLVTAVPLVFALALALVPARTWPVRDVRSDKARTAAAVVALLLMVPVGFFYFVTGLVAPAPDVYAAYALFGILVLATVLLARRRSWWTLAMPPASAGLWFLMLWAGETYLDWQP